MAFVASNCLHCGNPVVAGVGVALKKYCTRHCAQAAANARPATVSGSARRKVTNRECTEARFGPVPSLELSVAQAAWLAGFFDGEGTFTIARTGKQLFAHVSCANTNETVVRYVLALLGEHARLVTPKQRNFKHKPIYHVFVRRRSIPGVIAVLLPYIVGKKQQAVLVAQFCEVLGSARMRHADKDALMQLREHCTALNKRGVA